MDAGADEVEEALEEGEIRAWAEEPSRADAARDGRRVKVLGTLDNRQKRRLKSTNGVIIVPIGIGAENV